MKFVLGTIVTGSQNYWSLCLCSIYSALENSTDDFTAIYIATDRQDSFDNFASLITKLFGIKVIHVIPRNFYKEYAPKMKGNYATYWKFDLLEAMKEDEMMMYLDIDALCVSPFSLSNIFELMSQRNFEFAAVPSPRPVIERFGALNLSSPYSYFNAGFFVSKKIHAFSEEQLVIAIKNILSIDKLSMNWHDQDILNYLLNDKYLRLPIDLNISSGFLFSCFSSQDNLNYLSQSLCINPTIIHYSGDYLLNSTYHPLEHYSFARFKLTLRLLSRLSCTPIPSQDLAKFVKSIMSLADNSRANPIYLLIRYLIPVRNRFARKYYYNSFRMYLKELIYPKIIVD